MKTIEQVLAEIATFIVEGGHTTGLRAQDLSVLTRLAKAEENATLWGYALRYLSGEARVDLEITLRQRTSTNEAEDTLRSTSVEFNLNWPASDVAPPQAREQIQLFSRVCSLAEALNERFAQTVTEVVSTKAQKDAYLEKAQKGLLVKEALARVVATVTGSSKGMRVGQSRPAHVEQADIALLVDDLLSPTGDRWEVSVGKKHYLVTAGSPWGTVTRLA